MSTATATTLVVSEVFGPTIQGEGPLAGRPATFLRLGGCNLDCWWCDSAYTWDAERFDLRDELTRYSFDEVVDQLGEAGLAETDHLVVTGGEPLLQADRVARLLGELAPLGAVEVETNGTRWPGPLGGIVRFNVSPKLSGSGVSPERAWKPEVLREFAALARTGSAVMKLVVTDHADLAAADHLVGHLVDWPARAVWLMPEGTSPEVLVSRMPWLTEAAIERGWCVSPRLQVEAWGDKRGV